jgi:hypothetical protein
MDFKIEDLNSYQFMWKNNGMHPIEVDDSTGDNVRLKVEDAISVPNAGMWLPKVIQNIVKEAAEPLLVGTSLLQRVEYHYGTTITFPAVGALVAADIAEGMAYPERMLTMGGATVTASIGKSGVAVKITEEMQRYSQFDIINMHLRAAGRALARHKEQKIFNYIKSMGVTIFDNLTPTSSMLGVTHGRALSGAANGSIIMDDLFDMYAQVMMQGYIPNTLLMHPLCWSMFVKDPVLRTLVLNGASGGTWFATHSGNPSTQQSLWGNSSQGKMGVASGQDIIPGGNAGSQTASPLTSYSQTANGSPNLPSYFPFPFRIIVSPFVDFDPATKLTDLMMFDSNELGALIVDEDVNTDEWVDHSVDIRKIKLRERYGIGIFNEGQAIAVAKNVKIIANEVVLPAQATQSVSGTLAAIPAGTAVV